MKLTDVSNMLLSIFQQNKPDIHLKKSTENILLDLYNDIEKSYRYVSTIQPYVKFTPIQNIHQIPRPNKFPSNSFPKEIRNRINEKSALHLHYKCSLDERKIQVHFVIENVTKTKKFQIEEYTQYVNAILTWLHIVNKYSSKSCSKQLSIYLYFTQVFKNLPSATTHILDQSNVNTAFTTTCPVNSEIVVYRKEEWFKVFLHETFHNFALDFSDMDIQDCHKKILNIFKVKSDVNLFEAYTEFWARIMNCCFCSFFKIQQIHLDDDGSFSPMKPANNIVGYTDSSIYRSYPQHLAKDMNKTREEYKQIFLFYFKNCIEVEIIYGFFQMVKTLNFMGLRYQDLYSNTHQSKMLRENLYKENTSVLSYYVLQMVLLNSFQSFLEWCSIHNTSLLQFKKTYQNQRLFCDFIEKKYKTKSMLGGVEHAEEMLKQLKNGFLSEMKQNKNSSQLDGLYFLLNNMRMTVCEIEY